MLLILLNFLCVFSLRVGTFQSSNDPAESTIKLPIGTIQGNILEGCREFAGIPYAEPPVRNLRWADPIAKVKWDSLLYTQKFSAGCPQNCSTPLHTCPTSYSEDCLYLNVYTPRASALSNNPLPIMVWFHGGQFFAGAGGVPIYNASYIAATHRVVVVTVNYRLGALGFLASTSPQLSGSWGFKDQQLALKWVQDYASFFGGDKTQVTIFGQSSGATSVASHLVCPTSEAYFHRAIMESNPFGIPLKTRTEAGAITNQFASYLGCQSNNITCLREKPVKQILEAQGYAQNAVTNTNFLTSFYPWAPVIDGELITDNPITLFRQGKYQKSKPILMGTVLEEALSYVYGVFPSSLNPATYVALGFQMYDLNAVRVLALYPPTWGDNRAIAVSWATDAAFFCANRYVANALSDSSQAPVWVYRFDQVMSFNGWNGGPCVGHVCHGSELPYLFHSWSYDNSGYRVTPEEQRVANFATLYWTNFAKTGNPNTPSQPSSSSAFIDWPRYSRARNTIITINSTFGLAQNYRKRYCDLLDSLGPIPYIKTN